MSNKFLGTSASTNISNGSTTIFGSSLGAVNLNPSEPIKTNSLRELVSSKLDIADTNNLQSELNIKNELKFIEGDIHDTPTAGRLVIYAKTDKKMYQKDDTGTETLIGVSNPFNQNLNDTDDVKFNSLETTLGLTVNDDVFITGELNIDTITSKTEQDPVTINDDVCITGELNIDTITSKTEQNPVTINDDVFVNGELYVDPINNKSLNQPLTINSDVFIDGNIKYTNKLKNVIHFRGAIDNTTANQYLSYVGETGFAPSDWCGLFMPVQNIQFTDITVKLNNNTIGDGEIKIDLEKGDIANPTTLSSIYNETYNSSSLTNILSNNLYKHTDLTSSDFLSCLDNQCFGIKLNITPNTATINSNIIVSVHYITKSECAFQLGDDIDGEATDDRSGYSVSLSEDGTIVAIGALNNDGNGPNSGHVRVYQYNGKSWNQLGGDINGEGSGDNSGKSVSLSSDGTIVAIGARYNDGNGSNSGHVRVYQYGSIGKIWNQLGGDIDGEASNDHSGWSVSLSSDGKTVAIGARLNDGNGSSSGHARVYEYDGSTWNQLGGDIDGESANDESGWSVSLSSDGTIVAIGALNNDGNGSNSGHVRVYEYDGTTWNQLGGDIDGEAANDLSGRSVSLSSDGTIVAIGAQRNDGNGTDSGHARVYQYDGATWNQLGVDIDGEAASDNSGRSVSLSSDGTIVAIGAINNDGNGSNSGHVRVYEYDGTTWQLRCEIDGEAASDNSGWSVSLSADGKTVAIGAYLNDDNGNDSGHTRVYQLYF